MRMKTLITILFFCGLFLAPAHCCGRRKCPGELVLTEGKIIEAKLTKKSIEDEAKQNIGRKLFSTFIRMKTSRGKDGKNLSDILAIGKRLELDDDETKAVRLYTMENGPHDDLNTWLRTGKGSYQYTAMHYWLYNALTKLPKFDKALYRGYKAKVIIKIGTKLKLPGFTSTSELEEIAQKNFSSPSCTVLKFDYSRQAGSVIDLSEFPHEREHVIPPTERFEVYEKSSKDDYDYIHLRPIW